MDAVYEVVDHRQHDEVELKENPAYATILTSKMLNS